MYDLYLERYLPAAKVCGAHVDCTCLAAGDCAPDSLREGHCSCSQAKSRNRNEHLQVMMGYEGYDNSWTLNVPVTFLTAILQVLPLWLHITSSTQLPQLHPKDISTQISFPFYLDQLHSLKLTAKSTWKWRSSAVIFGSRPVLLCGFCC